MNQNKITDIYYFPLNHELSLEIIEQIFLQMLENEKICYEHTDNDMVFHLSEPPNEMIDDLQKDGIHELKKENKNIGYIARNNELTAIIAYI